MFGLDGLVSGLFNMFGTGYAADRAQETAASTNRLNQQMHEQDIINQWGLVDNEHIWQEDMYNKYQSPSALVQQMEQAGMNPALWSSSGGGNFNAGTPSAPAAIPAQQPQGIGAADMISSFANLLSSQSQALLNRKTGAKAEQDILESIARMPTYRSQVEYNDSLIGVNDVQKRQLNMNTRLTYQKILESRANVKSLLSDASLHDTQRDQIMQNIEFAAKRFEGEYAKLLSEVGLNEAKAQEAKANARNLFLMSQLTENEVDFQNLLQPFRLESASDAGEAVKGEAKAAAAQAAANENAAEINGNKYVLWTQKCLDLFNSAVSGVVNGSMTIMLNKYRAMKVFGNKPIKNPLPAE